MRPTETRPLYLGSHRDTDFFYGYCYRHISPLVLIQEGSLKYDVSILTLKVRSNVYVTFVTPFDIQPRSNSREVVTRTITLE